MASHFNTICFSLFVHNFLKFKALLTKSMTIHKGNLSKYCLHVFPSSKQRNTVKKKQKQKTKKQSKEKLERKEKMERKRENQETFSPCSFGQVE